VAGNFCLIAENQKFASAMESQSENSFFLSRVANCCTDNACLNLSDFYNAALSQFLGVSGMGSRRRGSGRRKVGRKKRRMRAKIRHRK